MSEELGFLIGKVVVGILVFYFGFKLGRKHWDARKESHLKKTNTSSI